MRRAGGQGSRRACRFSASLPCLQAAGHMHQALFRAWLSCPTMQAEAERIAALGWAEQQAGQQQGPASHSGGQGLGLSRTPFGTNMENLDSST